MDKCRPLKDVIWQLTSRFLFFVLDDPQADCDIRVAAILGKALKESAEIL
jgi:hypothetical protein